MMTHGHRIPAMVVDAPLPRLDPAVLELGGSCTTVAGGPVVVVERFRLLGPG
jgi:hypothetical protein